MVKTNPAFLLGTLPCSVGKSRAFTLPPLVEINNTPRGLQGECPDAVHGPGGKEESKGPLGRWTSLIGKIWGTSGNILRIYANILRTYWRNYDKHLGNIGNIWRNYGETIGKYWEHMEKLLGNIGNIWRKLLGNNWEILGTYGETIGKYWEHMEKTIGKQLGNIGNTWRNYWEILGTYGENYWETIRKYWEHMEKLLGNSGNIWRNYGETIGKYWEHTEKLLGNIGNIWRKLLGNNWEILGTHGETIGKHWEHMEKLLGNIGNIFGKSWKILGTYWENSINWDTAPWDFHEFPSALRHIDLTLGTYSPSCLFLGKYLSTMAHRVDLDRLWYIYFIGLIGIPWLFPIYVPWPWSSLQLGNPHGEKWWLTIKILGVPYWTKPFVFGGVFLDMTTARNWRKRMYRNAPSRMT